MPIVKIIVGDKVFEKNVDLDTNGNLDPKDDSNAVLDQILIERQMLI